MSTGERPDWPNVHPLVSDGEPMFTAAFAGELKNVCSKRFPIRRSNIQAEPVSPGLLKRLCALSRIRVVDSVFGRDRSLAVFAFMR